MKPTLRRAAAALLAILPALALAPTASATPTTVAYACRADTPLGTQDFSLTQPADVSAPATAASGSTFAIVVDPAAATAPASVGGFTLRRVQNLVFKVPIPANTTFASGSVSGGVNVGTTALSVSGGVATLTATGPVSGGASFELPTITLNVVAGAPGTTATTTLYGTGYTDPGLTATAIVRVLFDVSVPAACYPDPNPVITTTAIV
ncbi:cyclase [Actinosynnema pretiosum subsp. pretiosum]|uniref:Cyclase n=1 Tax=Actinosynnema pretiosum subsp. pretiosum TaxID=103721 RepID=A0AA45L9U5_9PSEU|nr:putative cyclase-dehydratase [Actinosynnema pretiosum subsp. pretiosum]QUF06007.1 cyclase [Actinosynnema pretiosum subsp. pretiosum]